MAGTHGFELVREQRIAELNTTARLYRHIKTGAQLLSMINADENKVFGISFATPPTDSTGLPHIMEHSVLCGSRKYPVKEPFVELIKGSLNTFVNAMTFSDKTIYPAASQNVQDFYNLFDVYMDAVFYPRITPETLKQEGWHYELDNADDPLTFKGVVFNEMKGAYSSPENLMGRLVESSLLPDTPYGVDSGGDPAAIPDLTYDQFKTFHETYYHPSNALIWFYGDDDPDQRLERTDSYLRDFDAREIHIDIPLQPRFTEPRRLTYGFPASDEGESHKSRVAINWLLTDILDNDTRLVLDFLSYMLIGTQASPLRKALIDSGLGEDLAGGGFEDNQRQIYFSTGLKGLSSPDDAEAVETLIFDTLNKLAAEGLEQDLIDAALNTYEFRLRELNTGSFPRGLSLMIWSLSTWLYGGDPLEPLAFEAPLTRLKERLKSSEPLFQNMIRTHLIDNPHRTTLLLKPDPEMAERNESVERDRLAQVREKLNSSDIARIVEETRTLKLAQETPDSPEALATLPTLKLEDLDRENKTIPVEFESANGATLLTHDLFTNGIVYLDLAFDLRQLPTEALPYLPLFATALTQIGTENEDFVRLSRRIGAKTGGISAGPSTMTRRDNGQLSSWLMIRGKSTIGQTGDLLDILRDILLTVKFDNLERFRQLVLKDKASHEARLIPGGHSVASARLRSHFTEAGWVSEQMGGISQLFFLRSLAERLERDWPSILALLQDIQQRLINRNALIVNLTLDAANQITVRPQLDAFLNSLPAAPVEQQTWKTELKRHNEGLTIPGPVNYVAKGANLYDHGYTLDGSVMVITNFLRTTWLWEKVRVQGGAYGGMCAFDSTTGVFNYVSYRDPNLLGTVENFDNAAEFLRELDLDEGERVKSIIGAIGTIDDYQLPDAKGFTSLLYYLTGDSDERRQKVREEVLSTTADDFRAFGEILRHVGVSGDVVVLGGAPAIQEADAERGGGWLETTRVL